MSYILKSRETYNSSEEFRDSFLNSLTPGVIERKNFIQWDTISAKRERHEKLFGFFKQIDCLARDEFTKQFADALMSADVAMDYVNLAFELLGHTGKNYVSNEDYIDFKVFSEAEKTEELMLYVAEVLYDLGLNRINEFEIDDYFTGVQVGLETHRRKNVGGTAFSNLMETELNTLVSKLEAKGLSVKFKKEDKVFFTDMLTSKTVDFSLASGNKKIGIEVNFYTASGSKPTEIKRSYGHINSELDKVDTLLVWVTDGVGYMQMKKSLKEACDIHKNTYNYTMFKDSFEDDVIKFLKSD